MIKRIRLIRSWAVPNVSPTWEITPCVNAEHGSVPKWISISQESPNPWMRTPSMTMISLFLNFSGLANQFIFFIDTSSRYKKDFVSYLTILLRKKTAAEARSQKKL